MKSRDFCYWLQGYFELADPLDGVKKSESSLTHQQIEKIKSHLAMVFAHEIDPGFEKDREKLAIIHHGVLPSFDPGGKLNC